jgi:hypothetical protein
MVTTSVTRSDYAAATFREAGLAAVDFDQFHRVELPRRLARGGCASAVHDVAGASPIAIQLDAARAYTYVAVDGGIDIRPGVAPDAEVVLEIQEDAWQDYVYEFRTRHGLLYSQTVRFLRGTFEQWDRWDPALRCMYAGREVYDPLLLDLRDRDGAPLDLHRNFTLDDSDDDLGHFLRTTGYLVVKNVFSPDRIQAVAREVERLRDAAREGEPTAWFTTTSDGERICHYLTYCAERSAAIAALDDDPVVRRLAALAGVDLVPVPDRVEGHKAVLKEFGTDPGVTGFANLPWHTDCGMGGCAVTCPSVSIGMQLDPMGPQSSQLFMMPASWGKAAHQIFDDERRAAAIALEADAGDATVHFGCNLHAGFGPTGPDRRRTLYTAFYNPHVYDVIGPHQGYQDQIPGWGSGQVQNTEEFLESAG